MFLIFFSLSILQGRLLFFSRWKTSVVTSQVAFLTSRENHIEPDAIQTKLSFPTRYSLQTLVKNMLINKAFYWVAIQTCSWKGEQNEELFIWSKFWFRLKKTLRRAGKWFWNDSEHFEKYFVRFFLNSVDFRCWSLHPWDPVLNVSHCTEV